MNRQHSPTGEPAAILFISFATAPRDPDARTDRFREIGQQRADKAHLRLVHEIVEMGASATTFQNRVAVQTLFNYFDNHPDVRYLIVPSIGRLSRNWKNLRLILKEFRTRNIYILTFDGHIAESGEIAASIGAAMRYFAESEVVHEGELLDEPTKS